MANNTIEVKTLLGHKGLAFSIDCLKSFVEKADQPIRLKIFEDGTLTNEDKIRLQESFTDCTLVDIAHCSKKVYDKLQNFPACTHYRQSVVYARKIFDLMLYDEQDCLYIDSDIYFIRSFSLPSFTGAPVFMYDSQNGYSFKPGEFLKIKHPVYPRVNSGFFFFPYQMFDLHFIEQLLKDPIVFQGFVRGISWLEQTIWAFCAHRAGDMHYFDPRQLVMADKKLAVTNQTVGVHLVSTYRNHYETVRGMTAMEVTNFPLRLVKAKVPLRTHRFFIERVIKRLRRYL